MEKPGSRYRISGHLTFNRRLVPRTPTRVELEILLVDESFACTRQIDRTVTVTGEPVVFTFHAPDSPTPIPAHLLRAALSGFELTAPEA